MRKMPFFAVSYNWAWEGPTDCLDFAAALSHIVDVDCCFAALLPATHLLTKRYVMGNTGSSSKPRNKVGPRVVAQVR